MTTPPTPEQLAADLDELAVLWPALPAALPRDAGTSSGERVTTTTQVHTIPINADVATVAVRLAHEIPAAAWAAAAAARIAHTNRDIPGHLRHLPVLYEKLLGLHRTSDAERLAKHVNRWHTDLRGALGLNRPDRPLRANCPRHDDPLVRLVEPGDRGWLRYDHLDASGRPVNPWISWLRHEAVTCRHCGAVWTPGQYLWLGRLIDDAERRRTEPDQPDGEAA